ncbi:TMEM165/GDT1 family protein [Aeromonas veronii]|uniref:TMEM165/GDT1 family protein n=1 Tax=Aeromonas veronii TaxID=654 RepID=UPI002B46AF17|nr:TMEM165/GDT1 family protein [Aeromonas veronii]
MTPVQQQAIPAIRRGRDVLASAQTGTGKTAAFALPILQRLVDNPAPVQPSNARVLILTPTRELAAQVASNINDFAKYLDITTITIVGGGKQDVQAKKLKAGAAWIGEFISRWLDPKIMTWLVAIAFIAMAIWILVPDKMDDEESPLDKYGPFMATFVLFFIAEIGDKTQIATVLLAAKYDSLVQVITGTTLGMMLANVPVVLIGKLGADKLPLKGIRIACAILFVGLGVSTLIFA